MSPLEQAFKVLTREQAERFLQDGYIVVRDVFPREVAEGVCALLWDEMPEDPDDPSSWTREGELIGKVITEGAASQVVTQRYRDALEDICGRGRLEEASLQGVGYSPIRFPMSAPAWEAIGWHVDGSHFHHFVTSRTQGLIGLDILTDVEPQGGGTSVRPGSHRATAAILVASEPEGMTCHEIGEAARDATADFPVEEVIGRAGDCLFMHPHLVHGSSLNLNKTVRMASNRCVGLEEPMTFHREREDAHSLVEWAVRDCVPVSPES